MWLIIVSLLNTLLILFSKYPQMKSVVSDVKVVFTCGKTAAHIPTFDSHLSSVAVSNR